MNHHIRGFIDHKHTIIFIQDIQRDLLPLCPGGGHLIRDIFHGKDHSFPDRGFGLGNLFPVQENMFIFDESLEPAAAPVRTEMNQTLIQSHSVKGIRDRKCQKIFSVRRSFTLFFLHDFPFPEPGGDSGHLRHFS